MFRGGGSSGLIDAREGAFEGFDALPDGVVALDAAGSIRFANRAARALLTLSSSARDDGAMRERLDPRDRVAFDRWLLADERESLTVRCVLAESPARRWVSLRAAKRPDDTVLVTIREVTGAAHDDRSPEQVAESLRLRAAMLESVLGASPLGVYMVPARSDEIVWFSHRLCDIWRMEHLEAGMRDGSVKHSDVLAHCAKMIVGDALSPERCVALWREAKRGSAELEVELHDGRTIRWIAAPVRDEHGRTVGMLFLDEDITERKRHENERAQAAAQFRELIEHAHEAILVHRHGVVVYANPTATSMLGYATPDELRGLMLDAIAPERRSAWPGVIDVDALRENHWRTVDGRSVTVESSRLEISFRGAPATLLIARDVTERNEMRARLLQTDRLASVGTLAAGVAHELNNPIAYMLLNLEYIRRGLDEELRGSTSERLTEVLGLLADTTKGALHVRDIVRDLKTFSRPDDVRRSFVDVRTVLDATLQMAKHEIGTRARVIRDFDEVPPVCANESRLAQVFLNLVLNAVQAIPVDAVGDSSGHEIRVRAKCPDGAFVVVEVSDTGCGIEPAILPHVFDPFFTTKPVGVGTGLGLSICHGIVSALGGTIDAESTPGNGATLRVKLPVEIAPPVDDAIADTGSGI